MTKIVDIITISEWIFYRLREIHEKFRTGNFSPTSKKIIIKNSKIFTVLDLQKIHTFL